MKIDLEIEYDWATINFDGTPHLIWQISQFVSLFTYKAVDRYVIHMLFKGGVFMSMEYDSLHKMERVLYLIRKTLG